MKKSNSETEFDKSDYTCPFLDGECQKDCCTHFERYKSNYECMKFREDYNGAICHAGQHIQLWFECIRTDKPPQPTTWKDYLYALTSIAVVLFAIYLLFSSIIK